MRSLQWRSAHVTLLASLKMTSICHLYPHFSTKVYINLPPSLQQHFRKSNKHKNTFFPFILLHRMEYPNFQFSASSSTAAKIERRIIEKNRRNQMKNLCDQLKSLVPQQYSKVQLFNFSIFPHST